MEDRPVDQAYHDGGVLPDDVHEPNYGAYHNLIADHGNYPVEPQDIYQVAEQLPDHGIYEVAPQEVYPAEPQDIYQLAEHEENQEANHDALQLQAYYEEEYDSGHESMEHVESIDDLSKEDIYDLIDDKIDKPKDLDIKTVDAESLENKTMDTVDTDADREDEKLNTNTELSVVPEENENVENVDYLYTPQRLPYNDIVSVLERTTSISSRFDLNHINPTDVLITSGTAFSLYPGSNMSIDSYGLTRPKSTGLLRRALEMSRASGLAQAGGDYHMGSLADVFHSIQSLRHIKRVEHPSAELPEKNVILKNYIFVCIGHFLVMMGFLPLRSMQTSLNHKDNLGAISTSVQLASYIGGALLTPIILPKFGIKNTLCLSMFLPILFIIANIYSCFWTLIPGGVITGVSIAMLYSTQAIYQTGMAYAYSVLTDEPINQVLPLFVAAYLTVIQAANVVGNLMTSTILKFVTPVFTITPSVAQAKIMVSNLTHAEQCGAGFCDAYLDNDNSNSDVQMPVLYILLGFMACCVVIGALFAYCGIDKSLDRLFVKPKLIDTQECGGAQWKNWLELHKDVRLLLIMILASFTAFLPNFIFSDSMKAYVTCPLGMNMLGYVTVCYGVCNALTTAATGPLARRIGWTNILYIGFMITIVIFVVKVVWYPIPSDTIAIFALFAACGAADPLFVSPCYGIIGVMFNDRAEHAFSLLTVYQAVVGAAAYGLSSTMCMTMKLYLSLGYLAITIASYSALEYIVRRQKCVNLEVPEVVVCKS